MKKTIKHLYQKAILKTTKTAVFCLSLAILSLVFGSVINQVLAVSWEGPTTSPGIFPDDFKPPINTSSLDQEKKGGLNIATIDGSVGIGTNSPEDGYLLDIAGTLDVGALIATGAVSFENDLNVGGNTTLNGNLTVGASSPYNLEVIDDKVSIKSSQTLGRLNIDGGTDSAIYAQNNDVDVNNATIYAKNFSMAAIYGAIYGVGGAYGGYFQNNLMATDDIIAGQKFCFYPGYPEEVYCRDGWPSEGEDNFWALTDEIKLYPTDTSWRVGIGTTEPSFKLQVAGYIGPNTAPAISSTSQTITTVDLSADNVGQYTSIAIGTDGLPVISYYDDTNDDLKVCKCTNASCDPNISPATCTTVDDSDNLDSTNTGQYSSIAIGTDGFPVISYYDATNTDLKVVKCDDASCSSGNSINIVDGNNPSVNVGQYTSLAIGTDGLPVISYYDATNGSLKVAKCTDVACSNPITPITVDSIPYLDIGVYSSIAIGTDGFPRIAYCDLEYANNGQEDLRVAKCTTASCSSATTTTVIGSAYYTIRYSSLAIGTDGLPVISYYQYLDSLNLKVCKCTNTSCTSASCTTVDSTDNVGQYTSIAIGTDGLPVISYYDVTGGNLKVAKCGNSSCSSGNTTIPVDSTDNVGQYTSIAIGTDGLPVISYYDATNGNLKVAKCANPSCSSDTGQVLTGGSLLGGWMANPRSYSVPFQTLNTIQIANPTTFTNLSFLTAGAEKMTIPPDGGMRIIPTPPAPPCDANNVGRIYFNSSGTAATGYFMGCRYTGAIYTWARLDNI